MLFFGNREDGADSVPAALQAKEGFECPRERAEDSRKNAP
jgi:hypothetical protein